MAESSFGRAGECRETCASLTAREGGAQGAVVRRHVGTSARRRAGATRMGGAQGRCPDQHSSWQTSGQLAFDKGATAFGGKKSLQKMVLEPLNKLVERKVSIHTSHHTRTLTQNASHA